MLKKHIIIVLVALTINNKPAKASDFYKNQCLQNAYEAFRKCAKRADALGSVNSAHSKFKMYEECHRKTDELRKECLETDNLDKINKLSSK